MAIRLEESGGSPVYGDNKLVLSYRVVRSGDSLIKIEMLGTSGKYSFSNNLELQEGNFDVNFELDKYGLRAEIDGEILRYIGGRNLSRLVKNIGSENLNRLERNLTTGLQERLNIEETEQESPTLNPTLKDF